MRMMKPFLKHFLLPNKLFRTMKAKHVYHRNFWKLPKYEGKPLFPHHCHPDLNTAIPFKFCVWTLDSVDPWNNIWIY